MDDRAAVLPSKRLRQGEVVLARQPDFRLGDLVARPSLLQVQRNGEVTLVEPRVMQVLVALAQAQGQTVGRCELLERCWSGRVVGDNSINRVISHLRRLSAVPGAGCFAIETIARVGYRLRVVAPPPAPLGRNVSRREPRGVSNGCAAARVHAAATFWRRTRAASVAIGSKARRSTALRRASRCSTAPAGDGVTLAVLPFVTLGVKGRDPSLEAGIADSLIVRLSTLPRLAVRSADWAPRAAAAFRDPLLAARELDAAWIVVGSLQRDADRLRVSVRLLRSADGIAAWSGSFDLRGASVLELQDQTADRVLHALASVLRSLRGTRVSTARHPTGGPASHSGGIAGRTHRRRRSPFGSRSEHLR